MTIKKIINKNKDAIVSMVINSVVSIKMFDRIVKETDDDIKDLDVDKADKEQKDEYNEYIKMVDTLEEARETLRKNLLSYNDLKDSEKEIIKILK